MQSGSRFADGRIHRSTGFLFALGLWTIADLAGLAYGRPFDPFPFDDKYYTSMMLTVVCAILALLRLGSDRKTALVGALGLAVFIPVGVAVWSLLSESPGRVHADREQEASYDNAVRPYLRTGDRSLLYDTSAPLPYWNGTELESQLDSPLMQPWLPAVLRECLVERSGTTLPGAQSPGPLTMLFRDLMKAGVALAGLGAAVFVWPAPPLTLLALDTQDEQRLALSPGTSRNHVDYPLLKF